VHANAGDRTPNGCHLEVAGSPRNRSQVALIL